MKAIRLHGHGGAEALVYETAPTPSPKPGEVLVRVHACGITPREFTWHIWKTETGKDRTLLIPGHELCGVIAQVGPGVEQWSVGEAVYGYTNVRRDGAAAQYCLALPAELASKPRSLDEVQAAAVPLSALTAWQALFEHGRLTAGQRVLIHGAGGGVGTFAVQLAHWAGASVIGVASARHHELLVRLGADEVIDYTTTRFQEVVEDVDLVFDTQGGETLMHSFSVLKAGGTLISVAGVPSEEQAAVRHVHALFFIVEPNATQLAQISRLCEEGALHPVVEQVFPLAQARQAYECGLAGHTQGKLVLRVKDDKQEE